MTDANKKKEAKQNFDKYLQDGLIKKEKNETARQMYLKNAELSLELAEESMNSELRPHLWVVVISYYSMFYSKRAESPALKRGDEGIVLSSKMRLSKRGA